jgi:hypothetical protein
MSEAKSRPEISCRRRPAFSVDAGELRGIPAAEGLFMDW